MSWPNFTREEFACQCGCGTNEIKDELIDFAQVLRDSVGHSLRVSSGYRCPKHPIEAAKATPGTHSRGIAADFAVRGMEARVLAKYALSHYKGGVGVNMKGVGRFVHVDVDPARADLFWTY